MMMRKRDVNIASFRISGLANPAADSDPYEQPPLSGRRPRVCGRCRGLSEFGPAQLGPLSHTRISTTDPNRLLPVVFIVTTANVENRKSENLQGLAGRRSGAALNASGDTAKAKPSYSNEPK
jgi:hypothetical protein